MRQYFGDGIKIQTWNIAGISKDDTSTENRIIIYQSKKVYLRIVPQNYSNSFNQNVVRDNAEKIDVVKVFDMNLMRTRQFAIQFGKRVLLENVGKNQILPQKSFSINNCQIRHSIYLWYYQPTMKNSSCILQQPFLILLTSQMKQQIKNCKLKESKTLKLKKHKLMKSENHIDL